MARTEDLLEAYRKKRDFAKTSEPQGGKGAVTGNIFVVQKHDATRLHYDFRLEYEGVLKSWAVTRGPSLDPSDKRLAVRTEDHPLDYATFEGTIPEGEYGGGTVMLWDFGTWEPLEDPEAGFKDGKLKIHLEGERMKGDWALVRMKPRKGEKRENWLLIKEKDSFAREDKPLTESVSKSVSSGRSMEGIAKGLAARKRPAPKRAKASRSDRSKRDLPAFFEPQLATLVDRVPGGEDWLFELKYDGYRCVAAISGDQVRLYTRNENDWTEQFSVLVPPFSRLTKGSALIDGEICAFDDDGKTSFSTLKTQLSKGGPLVFFAFDLLEQDGRSLRDAPLRERKAALEALLGKPERTAAIQFSPDIQGKGEDVFAAVCKAGHEGIIAKRADAPYRSGRGKSWLKIKCTLRQELIIVGWTPSDKRRNVFASLLIATEEDDKLVYRGRVGTGFSESDREQLTAALEARNRKTAPLSGVPKAIARSARWVRPDLVGEVAYTERTPDGVLRHPSFLGLREDKPTKDIGLETPMNATKVKQSDLSDDGGIAVAEREGVRLTHPDRVLYPDQGVTKGKLAAYYAAVAEAMLPFIADHPLSLVRCPGGREKQCFFQKHDTGGFADAMKKVNITESSGETADYFYVDDLAGVLAGVQMGVLEFHLWGSRRDNIEKPDRLIFDLDPDEGLDFSAVKHAAGEMRERLDALGLESFPMVTGGKGVHVIAPLARRAEWDDVKAFAAGVSRQLADDAPERFTANMSKAKRKGRIFLDYLRNDRGSTAIAPYSTRSRAGAPVAMPVSWEELAGLGSANGFSLEDGAGRAAARPWADYFDIRQSVTKAMLKAVAP